VDQSKTVDVRIMKLPPYRSNISQFLQVKFHPEF